MSIWAIDFCHSPPLLANDQGIVWQVPDSWQGRKKENRLVWDGQFEEPTRVDHLIVRNPAAALDRLETEDIPGALFPWWKRCIESSNSQPDWVVILVSIGVSPESAAALIETGCQAGCTCPIIIMEGSCIYALTEPSLSETIIIERLRPHRIEVSEIQIQREKNLFKMHILEQRVEKKQYETKAMKSFSEKSSSICIHDMDFLLHTQLPVAAQFLEQIRNKSTWVQVFRNGSVGIRHGAMEFIPLLDEMTPITAQHKKIIDFIDEPVGFIELWFGFNNYSVHPLRRFAIKDSKLDRLPANIECIAERKINGQISVRLEIRNTSISTKLSFPVLIY